jgi:hypothetical protein
MFEVRSLPKLSGTVAGTMEIEGLRIEIVSDFKTLARYADAWDRLALEAPYRLPMLSHAWVSSYFEHLLEPRERRCCVFAFDGDTLVGVLSVVATPHPVFGSRHPRLRTLLGSHSYSGDVLVTSSARTNSLRALLSALESVAPDWFCLEMRMVRDGSPALAALGQGISGLLLVRSFWDWLVHLNTRPTWRRC